MPGERSLDPRAPGGTVTAPQIYDEPPMSARGMAYVESKLADRRGQPPIDESTAPAILHIDLAEALSRAAAHAPVKKPTPLDAMEWQLLEAAKACAAGDEKQRPSRELIAVALREVEREQAFRDEAEAHAVQLERQVHNGRALRRDQFQLFYELVEFIARTHGIQPSGTAVMAFVRAQARTRSAAVGMPAAGVGDEATRGAGDGAECALGVQCGSSAVAGRDA